MASEKGERGLRNEAEKFNEGNVGTKREREKKKQRREKWKENKEREKTESEWRGQRRKAGQ